MNKFEDVKLKDKIGLTRAFRDERIAQVDEVTPTRFKVDNLWFRKEDGLQVGWARRNYPYHADKVYGNETT